MEECADLRCADVRRGKMRGLVLKYAGQAREAGEAGDGLASFCHQWFKLVRFKPSWPLAKRSKCRNILGKSTHFFAEQTQTGHHLLSIQPGLK